MFYENGDKYEGEWNNGKEDGHGMIVFTNSYKPNGKGIMYFSKENKYEGEFKDGRPNGKGIMYYSNGDNYEGEWKYGKKNGYGTMVFSNSSIKKTYEGQWYADLMCGYGTITYNDGDKCIVFCFRDFVKEKKWILSDFKQLLKERMDGILSDTLFYFADTSQDEFT